MSSMSVYKTVIGLLQLTEKYSIHFSEIGVRRFKGRKYLKSIIVDQNDTMETLYQLQLLQALALERCTPLKRGIRPWCKKESNKMSNAECPRNLVYCKLDILQSSPSFSDLKHNKNKIRIVVNMNIVIEIAKMK